MHMINIELYAVQFYGLTKEYQKYLLSDAFSKAVDEITEKGKKKGGPEFMDELQKILVKAMNQESPRLAKIYSSSRYNEAKLCMVWEVFEDANKKKTSKEEVQNLMLIKEVLTRRLQEALDGFYPLRFETAVNEMATDLRAYYRKLNCPNAFAEVFSDYLNATDALVAAIKNQPKSVSHEEALAIILIWTAAGGNPLEPARVDMQRKQNWNFQMQQAIEKLTQAENRLNKACIKYGLRF